jgi:PAS domain S-box-containing protein
MYPRTHPTCKILGGKSCAARRVPELNTRTRRDRILSESTTDPKAPSSPTPSTEEQFKKLVEVISRSQHNYRELIDNLDQAVFTLSLEGEIRVANRSFAEVLGERFHDLIGHRLYDFLASPTLEEAKKWLPGFLHTGLDHGRLPLRLNKSGDLRYFDCWVQAVTEEGVVTGVSGWARDVTSQHQAEIRFNEFFESLREGIFFTTPEGQVLDANPALVRMLGFESKAALQSRNFSEVYADPAQRDALVRELQSRGSVQDREIVLRRMDGSHLYCLASGFAIRDTFGRIVRLQGTLVDITERREIEKRLHQEQEFVRRLIACFPDMIAVFDASGRFTYVSPRVYEVLGAAPAEFVGQPYNFGVHPDDQAKIAESFQRVMARENASAQMEFRARHVDGSWRTLRASAGPLFDAEQKISGVVSSVRDITEAKSFEQQLLQKEKFASMGQMMAGAAHELNNPLTAILGVSDLLRERATDDASRRQIEIVLQQARRAAAIVQNLLVLAVPSGQKRGKVKADEIVRKVVDSHQKSLQQRNIRVDVVIAEPLPEVEGDPRLLAQVFTNILLNAEQAVSATRDSGTVKISLSHADDNLIVVFADDGPGIPREIVDKIYDPFFTTKRPGGGSGLGLTICLGVIKDHGGRIEVESPQAGGATFRIVLPAVEKRLPEPALASGVGRAATAAPSALRGRKLLIVDDEESIREIVQEGLLARGSIVESAGSSEEALSLLAANTYEVVLCDFNLPGLNGEQLFERLRAQAGISTPRFIFMTGDLLEPSTIASFTASGAHVLQKPFHIAALATLLSELLQEQPIKAN